MDKEILIALLLKNVDEKVNSILKSPSIRGQIGPRGVPGENGKSFVFAEHEETIRNWVKESALKFEDLTEEHKALLRGPKGRDGKDGKEFSPEENKEVIEDAVRHTVRQISDSLKLKFSDLTDEDISLIRGPRGRDGKEGKDGLNGRNGRDGKGFEFEEHREYFDSLKPKFSDFSPEEVEKLKLHFSDLTKDERASLQMRFHDLTEEERLSIRGPRGVRGQRGSQGIAGIDGKDGADGKMGIRGLPGTVGPKGRDGKDGVDGQDAPFVVDVRVESTRRGEIEFVFEFSDGTAITTNAVKLPRPDVYVAGGGVASSSEGGSSAASGKNGIIPAASFTGSPRKYDVVFAEAWTTEYVISQPVGLDARFWTVENVTSAGFTINSNADEELTGSVMYQAIGISP